MAGGYQAEATRQRRRFEDRGSLHRQNLGDNQAN
jgi:hypothetical protein